MQRLSARFVWPGQGICNSGDTRSNTDSGTPRRRRNAFDMYSRNGMKGKCPPSGVSLGICNHLPCSNTMHDQKRFSAIALPLESGQGSIMLAPVQCLRPRICLRILCRVSLLNNCFCQRKTLTAFFLSAFLLSFIAQLAWLLTFFTVINTSCFYFDICLAHLVQENHHYIL